MLCNLHHDPSLAHCHLPSKSLVSITVGDHPHCQPQVSTCYVSALPSPQHPRPQFTVPACTIWLPTCFPVGDHDSVIRRLMEAGHKGACAHTHTRHEPGNWRDTLPPPIHPTGRGPTLLRKPSNPAITSMAMAFKGCRKTIWFLTMYLIFRNHYHSDL